MKIILRGTLLSLLFLAFQSTALRADPVDRILLTINVTDLTSVVFSATGEFSLINDSSSVSADGITLRGVFSLPSSSLSSGFASSSLRPSGTTQAYDFFSINFASVTGYDVNFYFGGVGVPQTQTFQTNAAAFSGASTGNFNTQTFVPVGTTGDIIVGDTVGGSGATIGQWEVVPEPSTVSLLFLGTAGTAAWLIRRRRPQDRRE